MNTREERAAAMRQTWLGDAAGEAVAWDELKQCVRDRWLAAMDAAQPEVPPGVPSVDELTIIAWNEMRGLYPRMGLYDQANPLEQGTAKTVAAAIRDAVLRGAGQPSSNAGQFDDDEVEALARVLHKAYRDSRRIPEPWEDCGVPHSYRAEARAAIAHLRERSAVTVPQGVPEIKALREIGINAYLMHEQAKRENAGCIVGPQYHPADVAFNSRVPELEKQIAQLRREREDARREVDEVRRHISVTMSREHQARKEAQEAKRELSHLHPGETVEGVIVERDHYRIRLEYAEQDAATFRAELARESEWVRQYKQDRDDALAELEVVKAERDEYLRMYENEQKNADHWKANAALADAAVAELRDQIDDDNTNAAAVNDLLIKLQNVTAERDDARAELAAAIAHLRERSEGLPTAEELKQVYRDGWNEGAGGDTCASGITATPRTYTDDEVEKLARVLRETHAKTCGKVPDAYELDGFRNDARAAMDWMGATVGECKECEKLRKRGDKWSDDCVKLAGAIKNARAALEGSE